MTNTMSPDRATRELPLEPGGEVEILLTSNALRLRGIDGDHVVIRTRGGESIDDELTIETSSALVRIRDGGAGEVRLGPLRMRTRHPADLDIDIPRAARVSVRTLSGDVEAASIAGASRWATASGDLQLRVDGGPVSAESMSGDITVDSGVPVEVTARSVSGGVRLRVPELEALDASTTSGDIDVVAAMSRRGSHTMSSVSGDVQLATASPVRVEASTVTGDIRAAGSHRGEGGRGRRTLVVGDGSVSVSVSTMSGDVRLRVTRSTTAAPAPGQPAAPAHATPAPTQPSSAGPAQPWLGDAGSTDRREAARLEVLRALERGDINVDAATRRLAAIEEAGPRSLRGWC